MARNDNPTVPTDWRSFPGIGRPWRGSALSGAGALAVHAVGLTRLAERLNGACGCLLTFHRAAPGDAWAGLPNREFYLDADFLDRLLTYLRTERWDVVTLDEALHRAAAGDRGRFVNISVDDTYRDTFEIVVPAFRRAGVPVTLFVTTGIPDGTLSLWGAGLETILAENVTVAVPSGSEVATLHLTDAAQRRQVFAALHAAWEPTAPEETVPPILRPERIRHGCAPSAACDGLGHAGGVASRFLCRNRRAHHGPPAHLDARAGGGNGRDRR